MPYSKKIKMAVINLRFANGSWEYKEGYEIWPKSCQKIETVVVRDSRLRGLNLKISGILC